MPTKGGDTENAAPGREDPEWAFSLSTGQERACRGEEQHETGERLHWTVWVGICVRLKKVSDEFNGMFAKLTGLPSRETDQVENLLKKIRQLEEEREIISKFPVWPFNSASFRKFFSLVLSPLVPVLTSLLLDLVSRLI